MTLADGTQFGPYEIVAPLGAGGMGEVYRAKDTRLDRDIAIKVLPDTFARDPERVARFEREAKVLASLNHPNIGAIHGFEESEGKRFLVLELVEGDTLAERLHGGALPVDDSLEICKQIAEALETAHERGVIHRDLKPANVKVTPDGVVKVLDFGLAKAFVGDASGVALADSPTITVEHTRPGVVLGTAAYMSPEQARGKPLDKRTDIWSFGCVLYECLTGMRPFTGETTSDTIAKILEREPDFGALPDNMPTKVRDLLHRCLEKGRKQRLHDIADARIELDEVMGRRSGAWPAEEMQVRPRLSARARTLPWVLVALLSVATTYAMWRLRSATTSTDRPTIRLTVSLPSSERVSDESNIAISPDGTRLGYAATRGSTSHLYLRRLDQFEPMLIAETEGATDPFFSPDGNWIGILGGNKLKKVSVEGGSPITLSDGWDLGGCWGPNNTIYFPRTMTSGLWRLRAGGGTPEAVTAVDATKNEFSHWWPHVLPGGRALLFTIWTTRMEDAQIALFLLETGEVRTLLSGGANARYVRTGHLVYTWEHGLMAVPFDLDDFEMTGTPMPVLEDVYVDPGSGRAQFCVSENGTLAYVSSGRPDRALVWVDRDGRVKAASQIERRYRDLRLAPDGQRLAVTVTIGAKYDVWILDFVRDTLNPLTNDGTNHSPVWSPDGRQVAFASMRDGPFNVYRKRVDGTREPEPLLSGPNDQFPTSWRRDGQLLAVKEYGAGRMSDLAFLDLDSDGTARPFLQTRFDELDAEFSPDGRWIAYVSNETGRSEVYVRPLTQDGASRHLVSVQGGSNPRWSPKGDELFYRNGDAMMAVPFTAGPQLEVGAPTMLFEGRFEPVYDVAADGQRFLMIQADTEAATRINVVLNWFEELKAKVPTGK